jgi:hypothetical protein
MFPPLLLLVVEASAFATQGPCLRAATAQRMRIASPAAQFNPLPNSGPLQLVSQAVVSRAYADLDFLRALVGFVRQAGWDGTELRALQGYLDSNSNTTDQNAQMLQSLVDPVVSRLLAGDQVCNRWTPIMLRPRSDLNPLSLPCHRAHRYGAVPSWFQQASRCYCARPPS